MCTCSIQQLPAQPIRCRRHAPQRGAVAVMVAIMLAMLIGFAALAVDISNLFVVRNELQNDADAAAMAGAACLYKRSECSNLSAMSVPDWNDAQQRAVTSISLNKSAQVTLVNGQVAYGYWNLTGTPSGLQLTTITPTQNDVPAIQVTVSRSDGQNGGAVAMYLATVLGINAVPVTASAVAVVASPGYVESGVLFPVTISKCLYDNYWDTSTGTPKIATQTNPPGFDLPQIIGQPYFFDITSSYHAGPCESGQWTSLSVDSNSTTTIRDIITNGNPTPIAIGDPIWIQPGTKTPPYTQIDNCSQAGDKSCEYVKVAVVNDITTHSNQPVVAFACLHVILAKGGSSKYIEVQMSADADKCQTVNSGGGGPNYGALVPPRLVM